MVKIMTLQEFVNTYNGTTVGDGQCVYLIRYYIEQVLNLPFEAVGNAHQFYDDYENNEYLKKYFDRITYNNNKPEIGDIIVWSTAVGSGAGHIAIAYENINETNFVSFDQNWNTPLKCNIETHSYSNILGWLRVKIEPSKKKDYWKYLFFKKYKIIK